MSSVRPKLKPETPKSVTAWETASGRTVWMDADGNWAVEDEGVAPDIEVIDRPELLAAGRDPSLERGVAELLQKLQAQPTRRIEAPAAPQQFPRQ